MALPDISGLTPDQLRDLLSLTSDRMQSLEQQERQEQADRKSRIEDAITALDNLLGPVDAEAGVTSIRAVRQHSAEVMGQNAGIALDLAFTGLEQLTVTVRDLALAVANTN